MTSKIRVFGLNKSQGIDSKSDLMDTHQNLRSHIRNIEVMEMILESWEDNDVDDYTLSLVMNEGFEKLKAYHEEFDTTVMRVLEQEYQIAKQQ